MIRCTCQGVPNPECSYDHASENERIDALRRELASLPKFVAEAIQCIDAEALAALYVREAHDGAIMDRRSFADGSSSLIARAVRTYSAHCVEVETRKCQVGCVIFHDEIDALGKLIARYRS